MGGVVCCDIRKENIVDIRKLHSKEEKKEKENINNNLLIKMEIIKVEVFKNNADLSLIQQLKLQKPKKNGINKTTIDHKFDQDNSIFSSELKRISPRKMSSKIKNTNVTELSPFTNIKDNIKSSAIQKPSLFFKKNSKQVDLGLDNFLNINEIIGKRKKSVGKK